MPSWELFEAQSHEYKQSVFLPGVPVISIEVRCLLQLFVSLSLSALLGGSVHARTASGRTKCPSRLLCPSPNPETGPFATLAAHTHMREGVPQGHQRVGGTFT